MRNMKGIVFSFIIAAVTFIGVCAVNAGTDDSGAPEPASITEAMDISESPVDLPLPREASKPVKPAAPKVLPAKPKAAVKKPVTANIVKVAPPKSPESPEYAANSHGTITIRRDSSAARQAMDSEMAKMEPAAAPESGESEASTENSGRFMGLRGWLNRNVGELKPRNADGIARPVKNEGLNN